MSERLPQHRRLAGLESVLAHLAELVGPGGDAAAARSSGPDKPVLLLTGTARSGSTVTMWWLARSGAFAVPSNLVSRFWRAPVVGALVERLLLDPALDFRGELTVPPDVAVPEPYGTHIGKTRGPGAPHEFWYFWRHFLGFGNPPRLGAEGQQAADVDGFRGHLGAYEEAMGRPVALKAMIASWDLPWLAEVLPTALFVDLNRCPLQTMRSLLSVRERYFGDRSQWYSFRLPHLPGLDDLSPEEQVAVQVRAMRAAIDQGLARVAPDRVLRLDHAELCASPADTWARLRAFVAPHGLTLDAQHPDAAPLRPGRPVTDPVLERAWAQSAVWLAER